MSMGNGNGTGLGSGNGAGIGPGTGGNTGGGLRHIGGGVSAPVALYTPEPEFSEEARKAKVAGNVLVYLQVDTNGKPRQCSHPARHWYGSRRKGSRSRTPVPLQARDGERKPVRVEMNIDVNFTIF